jgi:class 3 adenylate cyclase
VICPNCATENDAGAKFCNECGTPLAAGCPNCGATNKPGAKFCNECGTALSATAPQTPNLSQLPARPAPAPAGPVAERRLVTVLFADLVGFTPFAADRDAEDVRETLSRYFDMCSEIVGRYGGTVEKFIGDAVMAVWGAPTAHEDDAERAVRAALDLVGAAKQIAPGVQARAGVLTGEAAVTVGATNQGLVAGDMVNTASRLQSVAPPGTVLVGEGTFRAASRAIAFEEAGAQLLKGKDSPVPAWRAVRVVAERGGRNRQSEGLEAPFVGREDELQLLKDLLHATSREERVRLVSVMGPGGIGKSRLASELSNYVDGLIESVFWHSGRSPAYGEGVTFWALGEMVRSRAGLAESDAEATTRERIAETVERWVTDEAQRAWIEKALLALLGLEADIPSDQLFAAWRTFFERISENGTVALVFEDLHHGDSGLLDFIDHLLEWSRGHPIYIVTLARPELLEKRPDWGAGKRNFSSIYLEPLAQPEMRELLAGLAPGLPPTAVDAIVERADGIPLYAVETVRMLVADGRLRNEEGVYVPAGDLTTLAVPETLTALISSRLDALDAADRSLLHDAAVLGQSFTIEGLEGVSGIERAELSQRLNALVRRELLRREVDQRSAERGQYAFMQALIREVAYNTLSKKDRKARHLAAARYFEQLGSDELASALAGHYLAAQQNATEGPEADALAAQARIALRGAAERAAALGAHDQAVALLQQAIAITDNAADRGDLLERASVSADVGAKPELAAELAREAAESYESSGDRVAAARATARGGWALLNGRRDSEARSHLEAGVERYGDLWPDPVIAELKANLARAYGQFEENEKAIALADEALAMAEHGDHPTLLARALITKGAAMGSLGRLREALALVRAGGEIGREHNLTEPILGSLMVAGYHLGEIDNVAAAESYREGLDLARRVGHRVLSEQFVNNIGYTGFLVGTWDEALAELDAVLAGDLDPAARIWLLSNELIIRASRGDPVDEGLAELERLSEGFSDPHVASAPMDTKANVAQAAGRLDEAQRYWVGIAAVVKSQAPASFYQAARPALWARDLGAMKGYLTEIQASGFHGKVIDAREVTVRAGIAALEGRTKESLAMYEQALDAWRTLRITWEEALTGLDMVTALDAAAPEIQAVAESTRKIFERLGARPYLERLNAALSRGAAERPKAAAGADVEVETVSPV